MSGVFVIRMSFEQIACHIKIKVEIEMIHLQDNTKDCHYPQKLDERHGTISPSQPWEETNPNHKLTLFI